MTVVDTVVTRPSASYLYKTGTGSAVCSPEVACVCSRAVLQKVALNMLRPKVCLGAICSFGNVGVQRSCREVLLNTGEACIRFSPLCLAREVICVSHLSEKSPMSRSAAAEREVTPWSSLTAASRTRTSRQEEPSWMNSTVYLRKNI